MERAARALRAACLRILGPAVLAASALVPVPASGARGPSLDAYRGLGAWVDIFDRRAYRDPVRTVGELASLGVGTLFLQTATYRLRGPIFHPNLAGRFLEAAHAAGLRVVAWYVPDFVDLQRDLDWSLAAISFSSPAGDQFDSFGLDIEVTAVADPQERARRLVRLSEAIRRSVGDRYPLGAITPAPLRTPSFWPVFPDERLVDIYDVYVPMAYFGFHHRGEEAVYGYTARSIEVVRQETGRPDMPIHLIGGLADDADGEEVGAFVRAVNQAGVLGASLYDAALSGPEDWAELAGLRFGEAEPERVRPRLLRPGVDLGAYGTLRGATGRPRREVRFGAGPLRGAWELDYEGFGLGGSGVELTVNGRRAATLTGPGRGWGPETTAELPRRLLRPDGRNVLAFAGGEGAWGVRGVTLVAGPLSLGAGGPRGAVAGSDPGREDRVTYAFTSEGTPVAVTVRGFDLADDEVRVLVNGVTVAVLPATPRNRWGRPRTIRLPPSLLRGTGNRLTFDSLLTPTEPNPWGIRMEDAGATVLA